jgi:hypothetical protein
MLLAVFMMIVNEVIRAELERKRKNESIKRCLNKVAPRMLIVAEALK